VLKVEEIKKLKKNEIINEDVMMMDDYENIFIWIGKE
jgi:hypothetical protein